MGQGLRGFSQAHIVGQDAAQALLAQVLQPGQALELVGAQLQIQPRRHVDPLRHADGLQAPGQVRQAGIALQLPLPMRTCALGVDQAAAQRFQTPGLPGAQAQGTWLVLRALWVGQQIKHRADN